MDQQANKDFKSEVLEKLIEEKPEEEIIALRFHLNHEESILKMVTPFSSKLTHLQTINLGYNNIRSLEPLQHMSLLHLEQLHLFSNSITSLRTLRKCSMPVLTFLSLANNQLHSLDGIFEINCPNLRQFEAYDNYFCHMEQLMKTKWPQLRGIGLGEELQAKQQVQLLLFVRFRNYYESLWLQGVQKQDEGEQCRKGIND